MKKIFYLSLALLTFCLSCNKEVEPSKTEKFVSLLKSKSWDVTSYELFITCGMQMRFPFKPIGEDVLFCSGANTNSTTSCEEYKGCETLYEWNVYTASFDDNHLSGELKTHIHSLNIDEDKCQHKGLSFEEEIIDNYKEAFHYNKEEETLTTNFGNIWNMFKDKEELTIKYSIISWSENKIVLEGIKYGEECSYDSFIVLQ